MKAALAWVVFFGVWGLALSPAEAQIFRYEKEDGTVAYTDKLSDLPPKRRAHYNRLLEAQRRAQQEMESKIRDERSAQAQAEARRRALEKERQADVQAKLKALDAQLESLRARNQVREQERAKWQKRYQELKKTLQEELVAYRKLQEDYQALAIQADFALLPGQKQKKLELREKLKAKQTKLDRLVHQLNVELPEEARKAGVPPGWIRG